VMVPGWSEATIGELIGSAGVFVNGDWIETKDQEPDGEVRLIQLADIGDGTFLNRSHRFLTLPTADRLGCTFLQEGDLLVARMPDPLGRATIFPEMSTGLSPPSAYA
jgi:type I restriction enzyme S subunit